MNIKILAKVSIGAIAGYDLKYNDSIIRFRPTSVRTRAHGTYLVHFFVWHPPPSSFRDPLSGRSRLWTRDERKLNLSCSISVLVLDIFFYVFFSVFWGLFSFIFPESSNPDNSNSSFKQNEFVKLFIKES